MGGRLVFSIVIYFPCERHLFLVDVLELGAFVRCMAFFLFSQIQNCSSSLPAVTPPPPPSPLDHCFATFRYILNAVRQPVGMVTVTGVLRMALNLQETLLGSLSRSNSVSSS
jgi:hypothetical protein